MCLQAFNSELSQIARLNQLPYKTRCHEIRAESRIYPLNHLVVPSKISLIILCSAVTLLLAPYAGCNGRDLQTHTGSEETASQDQGQDAPAESSNAQEKQFSAGANEPLDQIEDLLANPGYHKGPQ